MDKPIDVVSLFRDASFEVSGRKLENLTLQTAIADLSLDSVQILEIVAYVEERLDIRLTDDDLQGVNTLAELGALLQRATRRAA
jgi:acyl carrier protein